MSYLRLRMHKQLPGTSTLWLNLESMMAMYKTNGERNFRNIDKFTH